MESTETLNFDFDRVGSIKRRISSILKAPRTSVAEAGLKEPQEDKSKPLENRRSSRRVSFAATKNVVVFSKDIASSSDEQTPSPSLTPIGLDCQDANRGIHDGIDNLLNAPLQVPHNREKIQFFSDPVLPDGCNDNTVLFGEDTACMDMTHCHTIVIDKETDKSDLNFSMNTEIPVGTVGKPMSKEDAMFKKNIHIQSTEPADFGTFLASISQQKELGKNTRNERSYMARDQTILFGREDTACMDLTNCHTVENYLNETDLNFNKTAEMPASGIFTAVNKGSNILQRNVEVPNKSNADADFGVFLASLSKKKGCDEKSSAATSSSVPTQKSDSEGFLARLNSRRTVIDKENQPPALSDGLVLKPQSLRKSTTPSTNYNFIDVTTAHTVAMEGRGFLQNQQADLQENLWDARRDSTHAPRLISQKLPDPDDMDLTKSQTVAINFKSTDVARASLSNIRRGFDPNKTQIFSGDNVGMDFTGVIDVTARQENFPEKRTLQTENKFNQEWTVKSRKSLSTNRSVMFAQNDDDYDDVGMEMTEALTKCTSATGHSEISSRGYGERSLFTDPTVNPTIPRGGKSSWADMPDSDDMEITKSQTVIIDSKDYKQEKPVRSRKSLSANRSVMFTQHDDCMEMTEALTGNINASSHIDRGGTGHCNLSLFTDPTINPSVPSGGKSLWADVPDSDDMEITKSQTVVIDSKDYKQEKPVRSRKSLSANRTVMFTKNDDCMEMTEALTGNINASHHIDRGGRAFANQSLFTDPTVSPTVPSGGKASWADMPDSDDMEMTKSQTVVIDSKDYKQEKPVRSRKSLSANRSVMFTQHDDGMELTEAINGQIEPNRCHDKRECDIRNISMDLKMKKSGLSSGEGLWADVPDSDDMEMTRSQTVVIDSKDSNQVKTLQSSKGLSINRGVLFTQNEMTDAFTGHTDTNPHSIRDETDQTNQCVGVTRPVHQSQPYEEALCSEADDMEITKSQTVVIDSQNRKTTDFGSSHSSHVEIAGILSEFTESNQSVKGSVSRNSMRKSLSCVPSSLRNTMFENEPPLERKEATTVIGDDMEMTRSQTVVIDAKHKMNREDNVPKVHIPTGCRNDIFPMTGMPLPLSQASALQMSTACEEMGFSGKATSMDSDPIGVSDCYKNSKFFPSKTCNSQEMTIDMSFVTGQKNFFPSIGVDNAELTSSKHEPAYSQATRKSTLYMPTESNECYGAPHQELDPVDPMSQSNQSEATSSRVKGLAAHDRSVSLRTDKNVDSANLDPVPPSNHTVTERRDLISQKEKSRRRSLQDLQSKLRRLSQTLSKEPPQSVVDCATVPLPHLDVTEELPDNPKIVDAIGCNNQTSVEVISEQTDNVKRVSLADNETRPLTTRLSFGGFLPKLPSRPKPVATDHFASETTKTIKNNFLESGLDATSKLLDNFEINNISAEQLPEMSSEEDISETVDDFSLKQTQTEDGCYSVYPLTEDLEDDVFSSTQSAPKSRKRSCPEDGHDVPQEQKRKQDGLPHEVTESAFSSVSWDANTIEEVSNVMTKTIDGTSSSSNSTDLRSDATFESTNKYSQYDSQIDKTLDYEFDFHKKIEDKSITVNEFLKHFGLNFVIHRSRPSALPDNLSPNPTPQLEHLLKELYIYRPKQRVYESECEKLTDMVEGRKSRMLQQDHPLRHLNESLLQEFANLSKEQLLNFGSKLKERKLYFRKRSKIISHEMKTAMYSELACTTQEAKEKLEEKMVKTDALIKDLDACIQDLEAELATVDSAMRVDQVHAQSKIQPALKNKQQELERLDSAVAEKEGQIVRMEGEKRNKADKLGSLRGEVKDIKKHTSLLHSVNEWKLSLKEDERIRFSFLHETLFLEVVHQPSSGMLAPNGEMDQKLCDIIFDFQLNTAESECHTVMVHGLLTQLLKFENGWLNRYSTIRDIPVLLHEVSLAVSRIRLLGEEIHRLKRWGALRLGILEIDCADRHVRIVFSSLKTFVKFQLTLTVTCAYPFGGVNIQSFQNYIGNTRADQVEDLFSSIEPSKGYFTQIIKMIHDRLLI